MAKVTLVLYETSCSPIGTWVGESDWIDKAATLPN